MSADFLKMNSKIQEYLSNVWILIRSTVLSSLISVQTACKGYQQTLLLDKSLVGIYGFGKPEFCVQCVANKNPMNF